MIKAGLIEEGNRRVLINKDGLASKFNHIDRNWRDRARNHVLEGLKHRSCCT